MNCGFIMYFFAENGCLLVMVIMRGAKQEVTGGRGRRVGWMGQQNMGTGSEHHSDKFLSLFFI